MARQVIQVAAKWEEEKIRNEIVKKFISEDDIKNLVGEKGFLTEPIIHVVPNFADDAYLNCIDSDNGLKLRDYTANELYKEWRVDFVLRIIISEKLDENELTNLKNKIEAMLREFYDYLGANDVIFKLRVEGCNYIAVYEKDTDLFNWLSEGDYADIENTINGRLMIVSKMYLDDNKIISSGLNAPYNNETNCYELSLRSLLIVLKELGHEAENKIETVESYDRTFPYKEWVINGDVFRSGGQANAITKNGTVLIELDSDKSAKISPDTFGVLTNTEVFYDDSKKAIVVRSIK